MYIYPGASSQILSFALDTDPTSNDAASVVCSWPLSGQYGPGVRFLYYVLVAVCILGSHVEWMRGACLAAALLVPSVAAIHALIMTGIQQSRGPVDMDIFGCFQLCAIGVLAVPITVRYSTTYFETKGRNLVFMWTVLNLAGLVSLIVAFYRATPQPCLDSNGNNVTVVAFQAAGNNESQTICSPTCSIWTIIRKDTTNASQWVIAPNTGMTFNTATLLCAACCIPAILSLLSVWQKVMHLSWIKRFRRRSDTAGDNDGQPALTDEQRREREDREDERWMDKKIRMVLGLVERIVFTVCIMAIVVLGERNFWSKQMRSGVEPMTAIGQWGPIIGAVLAVLGPLFTMMSSASDDASSFAEDEDAAGGVGQNGSADPSTPLGHRAKVNKGLFKVLKVLGTPGADRFADEVRTRKYLDYPLIPGEKERNENLAIERSEFLQRREIPSRTQSFSNLHRPSVSSPVHTPRSSSPPLRVGSGADLAGRQTRRATERFLQVPTRTYTSPREETVMPVRTNSSDVAYHSGPNLPAVTFEVIADSDSDPSSTT